MMWKKQSTDSGVIDFCIAINGYIIISVLSIKDKKSNVRDTMVIIFNHAVYDNME